MSEQSALVIGATGLVGSHLVDLLCRDSRYGRVVVLARRPDPSTRAEVEWHVTDFERPESWTDRLGSSVLFNAMGTTIKLAGSREAFRHIDLEVPLAVATAAVAAGCHRLVSVSAAGADAASRVFYSRTKGELDARLAEMGFATVHILRPSLLLGRRAERRPAEAMGQALAPLFVPIMRGPLRPYRPIRAVDVATAAVELGVSPLQGHHVHSSDAISRLAKRAG